MSDAPREPQNIYDDPGFFAGYSTLERFGAGWERAMEHADLLALLPEVDGRRVLDLGCGAGQDRKSTRLNSSHLVSSYAVFCLKKKITTKELAESSDLFIDQSYSFHRSVQRSEIRPTFFFFN